MTASPVVTAPVSRITIQTHREPDGRRGVDSKTHGPCGAGAFEAALVNKTFTHRSPGRTYIYGMRTLLHTLTSTMTHTLVPRLRRLGRCTGVSWLALLFCLAGSAVITWSSVAYFDEEDLPAFVIEKLPLPLEDVWLLALQCHVVAAAIALPGCLALLSRRLLRAAPVAHRYLGRVVGLVVLVLLAPSGLYLSLFAKGGVPATAGFVLSGIIVVGAMIHGVRTARARDLIAHRRAMAHVVAQLSVAVTSRAMLFVLDATDTDPDLAYLVSLWLPVVGSALVVEMLFPRAPSTTASASTSPGGSHDARVLPRPVRPVSLVHPGLGDAA
jgi:hypothetical protein